MEKILSSCNINNYIGNNTDDELIVKEESIDTDDLNIHVDEDNKDNNNKNIIEDGFNLK